MKYFSFLITLFLLINIFIGCSDLQDEVTPPLEVAFHGTDIYNPQSQNYHGKLVSTSSNGLNDCQSCHAFPHQKRCGQGRRPECHHYPERLCSAFFH